MDATREELFTRTGLAGEQHHTYGAARDAVRERNRFLNGFAPANNDLERLILCWQRSRRAVVDDFRETRSKRQEASERPGEDSKIPLNKEFGQPSRRPEAASRVIFFATWLPGNQKPRRGGLAP